MTLIPPLDNTAMAAARDRQSRLTKPAGSLGVLEELSVWLAGVQGKCPPVQLERVQVVIFAADHGVATTVGTSAYPSSVTAQMVANFVAGTAAVNVLARQLGAKISVVDVGVDSDYEGLSVDESVWAERVARSTGSLDREDALTSAQLDAALDLGARRADAAIDSGYQLLIAGDMGIGNTAAAAAVVAALTGADVTGLVGRGTGIDDQTWMRKVSAVRDGVFRCRDITDPLAVLQRVGGSDLAAVTGFLQRAGERRTPVLLDGVISVTAALVAQRLAPGVRQWWWASHRSTEPAQQRALAELELNPLLDLQLRLGEGTGALLALPLLRAAVATLAEMATFEAAGVDGPNS